MGSPAARGSTEYGIGGRAAIIHNGDNQYTFRDANGNEGAIAVSSITRDPDTGRTITTLGSGWTLSIDPMNPDIGVIVTTPNGRERAATVIRGKGGYETPAPTLFSSAPELTASFTGATAGLTPESLGMGRKQFNALMEQQSQWERNPSKESSPVFKAQLTLRANQDKLGMGDSEFAALLKEQSEYMSRGERAIDGEDVGVMARTSPLQAALNRVTMSKQPEETGYQVKTPGL
ncbi:MAG: hypothetical protein JNL76_01125 [Alphaproteobacteria bacterium]|nr:hypothetical protein [Alphaproteobacteria bacterium]